KFGAGIPRAPDDNCLRSRLFRFVRFAHKGGQNMGALEIEIVIRSVQIGGHGTDKIGSELARIRLAEFNSRDLCHRIRLVGWLERSAQQCAFRNRLRRELRVNARAAEKQQLARFVLEGGTNDIVLDLEVLDQELNRLITVGLDSPHPRSRENNDRWFLSSEKILDCRPVRQVQLAASASEDVFKTVARQLADDRASHQSAVTGHKNPVVFFHRIAASMRFAFPFSSWCAMLRPKPGRDRGSWSRYQSDEKRKLMLVFALG